MQLCKTSAAVHCDRNNAEANDSGEPEWDMKCWYAVSTKMRSEATACASLRPKAFYCVVNMHNPTGIVVPAEFSPLGICTSSGTVGHSFSFGKADAAMICCRDAALADAEQNVGREQGAEKHDLRRQKQPRPQLAAVDTGHGMGFDGIG